MRPEFAPAAYCAMLNLKHLALVGQLATLADVRHPQLCVVPRHVGVVVAHPR